MLAELAAEQELDPEDAEVLAASKAHVDVGRALALAEEGCAERARESFEALAESHPRDPDPHLWLAVLLSSDDPSAAVRHVHEAVARAPKDPPALWRAAHAALAAGAHELTRELIARLDEEVATGRARATHPYRSTPVDLEEVRATVHLDAEVDWLRGELARVEGDESTALLIWREGLDAHPDSPTLAAAIVALHLDRDELRDAEEVLAAALRMSPDDAGLHRLRERVARQREGEE